MREINRYFKSYHEGNVITVYQGCSFFIYLFEDEIYQQTGSVATGSPLDPILAVSFMVELETTIVPTLGNLLCKWKKYVDDTIVIRNGKIAWKVVWIECYLRMNLSSRKY